MRIVSWNLGRNTVSRSARVHDEAWQYLRDLDPDIALLQEALPPVWATEQWDLAMAPVKRWGSAVIAKRHVGLRGYVGSVDTIWERDGYLVSASISISDGTELFLGSVHAPWMKALTPEFLAGFDPGTIKLDAYPIAYYYDVPYATFRERVPSRFVVSGDWNVSPILWDAHHPRSHERAFFARAAEDGWIDCYRRFHEGEGQTWFRRNDRPYQLDHAFCDMETAELLRSCEIDPYPAATLKVSDHAPLVIELAGEPLEARES